VRFGDQLYVGDAGFDYSFAEWMANALPDVPFTVDQLEILNAEGQFAQRLDLENIGLSGYSLGGGIVAMATAEDDRIKATISQDGCHHRLTDRIEQPMLFQAETTSRTSLRNSVGQPTWSRRIICFISFSDSAFWPNNLDMPAEIVDGALVRIIDTM
jgi:hypothetical protein